MAQMDYNSCIESRNTYRQAQTEDASGYAWTERRPLMKIEDLKKRKEELGYTNEMVSALS